MNCTDSGIPLITRPSYISEGLACDEGNISTQEGANNSSTGFRPLVDSVVLLLQVSSSCFWPLPPDTQAYFVAYVVDNRRGNEV